MPRSSPLRAAHRSVPPPSPSTLTLFPSTAPHHRMPFELTSLIDNAIYSCKPPEKAAAVIDTRHPIHRYVEHLIATQLSKSSLEKVVRSLRKLPWSAAAEKGAEAAVEEEAEAAVAEGEVKEEEEGEAAVVKEAAEEAVKVEVDVEGWVSSCLLETAAVKYHSINLVACVISALYRYHEGSMLRVVDAAIEMARCATDRNDYRECQRRICLMKLLGELYNYKLMDSAMVFKVLYTTLPRASGVGACCALSHVPAHSAILNSPSQRPVSSSTLPPSTLPFLLPPPSLPPSSLHPSFTLPSTHPSTHNTTTGELQHPGEPMPDGPDDCHYEASVRFRHLWAILLKGAGEAAARRLPPLPQPLHFLQGDDAGRRVPRQ